jgi:hypothetical protein
MNDREQALRRVLADALRSSEATSTPPFARLWAAARGRAAREPTQLATWTESLAAGVAVASVVAIGVLVVANMRVRGSGEPPDAELYAQLIAQTSWTSPTDILLDARARFPLAGLPELPAVNTQPSPESLL